jgi:hypothetical protein
MSFDRKEYFQLVTIVLGFVFVFWIGTICFYEPVDPLFVFSTTFFFFWILVFLDALNGGHSTECIIHTIETLEDWL